MAKRWLSLMVILTLLSTLFTGVALARDYDKPTAVKVTPSTATTEGRQAVAGLTEALNCTACCPRARTR